MTPFTQLALESAEHQKTGHQLDARLTALVPGCTRPQAAAMIVLYNTPGLTIGDLCQVLRMSPSCGTDLVDRMERNGWLVRDRSADDRRAIVLCLTPRAVGLFEARAAVPA